MSTWNHDEVEGKLDRAKGTVKGKVGEVLGDREMEAEGDAENAEGHAQETWGKVKRGVGDTVEAVGDAISNAGKDTNKA
ncbi:MAG TPA: CsbD family protein [Pyrinomonadaceae bacterium]|nr:CsbD family protein [Pyrinomonadaceae bacterium]